MTADIHERIKNTLCECACFLTENQITEMYVAMMIKCMICEFETTCAEEICCNSCVAFGKKIIAA